MAPDLQLQPNVNAHYIKTLLESLIAAAQDLTRRHDALEGAHRTLAEAHEVRHSELAATVHSALGDLTGALERRQRESEAETARRLEAHDRAAAGRAADAERAAGAAAARSREDAEAMRVRVAEAERRFDDDIRNLARRLAAAEARVDACAQATDVERLAAHTDALGSRCSEIAGSAAAAVAATQRLQEAVGDAVRAASVRADQTDARADAAVRDVKARADAAADAAEARVAAATAAARAEAAGVREMCERQLRAARQAAEETAAGAREVAREAAAEAAARAATSARESAEAAMRRRESTATLTGKLDDRAGYDDGEAPSTSAMSRRTPEGVKRRLVRFGHTGHSTS